MFCRVDELYGPAIHTDLHTLALTLEYRILPATPQHPGHLLQESPVLLFYLSVSLYMQYINSQLPYLPRSGPS